MSGDSGTPLRVVEISSGIAGAYCGWLLQQMGADVVRIGALPVATDPISLALAYYASDKRTQSAETVNDAVAGADLVITDDAALVAALTGSPVADLAASQPDTVFGVTSVFGLTGPLANVAATAIDAQAEAGVAWALGDQGRPPLTIPPGVLECQAGAHLAAASLMARLAGPAPKSGRIVDIALTDVLAHYVGVNCRFYIHHGMSWKRAGRRAADSGGVGIGKRPTPLGYDDHRVGANLVFARIGIHCTQCMAVHWRQYPSARAPIKDAPTHRDTTKFMTATGA